MVCHCERTHRGSEANDQEIAASRQSAPRNDGLIVSLIDRLPPVRGKYRAQHVLADTSWFRVGGPAEVVFKPADVQDLADFLKAKDGDISVTILGAASNVIIRDGGIDGVVIRLGRGFNELVLGDGLVVTGAANLDVNVAEFAAQHSLSGLEFLSGIPGAIGGALAMNAGAYGAEVKDVLVQVEVVTPEGEIKVLPVDELAYAYRHCGLAAGHVFTKAWFRASPGDVQAIRAKMHEIATARADSQPVRARTGGSTFRNPPANISQHKAWELIDAAGCRGMMQGQAQISEKHCNFLINTGGASAADLESLGDTVRDKVKTHSGVDLQWEIKRIGKV